MPDATNFLPTASRPCVLVVEDNDLICTLLTDVLDDDYEVICAAKAEDALLALATRRIDVMLLDYFLFGTTGGPVAERAGQAGVPIVWMTGNADALDALRVNPQIILPKPFGVDAVLAALAQAQQPRNCESRGGAVD